MIFKNVVIEQPIFSLADPGDRQTLGLVTNVSDDDYHFRQDRCTTSVPGVLSVLGVPGVPDVGSVLASWALHHKGSCCRDRMRALTLTFGNLGIGWASEFLIQLAM